MTRIKKNFIVIWTGKRGGENVKKFYMKESAEKFCTAQKQIGFKDVKVRQQTRKKVNVET